jgi:pimeloyl-ACP methyl ester carboxylesterase
MPSPRLIAAVAALACLAAAPNSRAADAAPAASASATTPAAPPAVRFYTDAELRAEYAGAPSQLVTVDGVPLHVRDEGRGPALMLLNGHLGSLQMWDAWMPALTKRFRVIRVDYPPYGLSGPIPSGDYSTRRAAALMLKLADRLGLQRFSVGGTSNGALTALFMGVEYPDRIERLVVSTLPASRPPPRTPSPELAAAAAEQKALAPYQTRRFFAAFLRDIVANDAIVTDDLIDRYWKLNNRAGAKAWVDTYIQDQYRLWDTLDVREYYARLKRPMLLQWGADGVVLPEYVGYDVAALLPNAPVTLVQYRGAGHLPMLEQPEATVRDAIAFLQGKPVQATPKPVKADAPAPAR